MSTLASRVASFADRASARARSNSVTACSSRPVATVCASDHGQRCRAKRRLDLLQAVDLPAQVDRQIEWALCHDGLPGRAQGTDRGRAVPVHDRALARGDEIVEVERQGAPARATAVPAEGQHVFFGAEAGEVPAMPFLRSALLALRRSSPASRPRTRGSSSTSRSTAPRVRGASDRPAPRCATGSCRRASGSHRRSKARRSRARGRARPRPHRA